METQAAPPSATARRALITTLVAGAVIVGALALWKLKLVIALFFLATIIAAAMRPGVEALRRRGIPRGLGVGLHYVVLLGLVALFLWFALPRALTQVETAVGTTPNSVSPLEQAANHSTGIKHQILVGLERRLKRVPSGTSLIHPAMTVTKKAFEVFIGIFFVFASAAYWIFERDRTADKRTEDARQIVEGRFARRGPHQRVMDLFRTLDDAIRFRHDRAVQFFRNARERNFERNLDERKKDAIGRFPFRRRKRRNVPRNGETDAGDSACRQGLDERALAGLFARPAVPGR